MSVLKNARIGVKLFSGFLVIAIIAAVVNVVTVARLAQIKESQQELYAHNVKPVKELVDLTEAFQQMRVASRDVVIATTLEAMQKGVSQRRNHFKIATDSLALIAAASSSKVKNQAGELNKSISQFNAYLDKINEMKIEGKGAEADAFGRTPEVAQTARSCAEQLKTLAAEMITEGRQSTETVISITKSSLILSSASTVIMLLIAVIFGILITRSITGPVHHLAQQAEKIASGDLTVQIASESHDEIGQLAGSFTKMAENLRNTLKRVDETSVQVASASSQLHSTSAQIATGAEEVSSQALTVATASEELSATSGDIANNCHDAARSSQQATNAAQTGAAVVAQTVTVMTRIADRVNSTARSVEALGTRSDQIGNIVGTIEDIADQTNLLALNAAIEAARAGEQGRGFAVVADEVRALAERTTKATKEISVMIKAIQSETKGAVAAMEEGVREVQQGTAEASKSGAALQEILDQINAVTMQVNQIATAAEEQSATTNEITNNIHQISDIVHQTAQGSQESVAAAGQLARLSDELRSLVKQFRL